LTPFSIGEVGRISKQSGFETQVCYSARDSLSHNSRLWPVNVAVSEIAARGAVGFVVALERRESILLQGRTLLRIEMIERALFSPRMARLTMPSGGTERLEAVLLLHLIGVMPCLRASSPPNSLMRASNSRCFTLCGAGIDSSLETDCVGIGDGYAKVSAGRSWLISASLRNPMITSSGGLVFGG
jgi:hypothetical protein